MGVHRRALLDAKVLHVARIAVDYSNLPLT